MTRLGTPADPERIRTELTLAIRQTQEVLAAREWKNLTPFVGAALFSIRFKRIQPFRDGNKRTGRLLTSAMLNSCLGHWTMWTDVEGYHSALRAASDGFLTPVINYLRNDAGMPPVAGVITSPFRLSPLLRDAYSGFDPSAMSFEDQFEATRIKPS